MNEKLLHNKWVWIGGAGLLVILLYLHGSTAASSAANPANAGIVSQQYADQTNVQLAQGQEALTAVQDQVIGQQNIAALQTYGNLQNGILALAAQSSQVTGGIVNNYVLGKNAVPLATIASQENLGLANINANSAVNIAQINASAAEAQAATQADAYKYAAALNQPYANTTAGQAGGILGSIGSFTGGLGGLASTFGL